MSAMYMLIPTLLVILFSFLIVRAAAIAFMMTGMDQKRARFQALSAFSGTGFTTKEAELIVNHPRRRQIATWLMILGNAGIVTVIVTATSSLVSSEGYQLPLNILILVVGAFLIYRIVIRTRFGRRWESFVENRFVKSQVFEESTTEDLLHLMEGYGLLQVTITEDSTFVGKSLLEANTPDNEFWIVGVHRGKNWISLPRSVETINEGDKLVVYGELKTLRQLFRQE